MKGIADIITREINERGPISFARFMELALYCPDCGYYEAEGDTIGKRGDFFTSVSVGNFFGELLAFQFAQWLDEMRSAKCAARIVEAGAHHGQLAKDILSWLRAHRGEMFRDVEYCIIEPSPSRQCSQKKSLGEFADRVRWFVHVSELLYPPRPDCVSGIIFSNELLDAMPAHRLGWDAARKQWFEWGVGRAGAKFVWTRLPATIPTSRLTPHASTLLEVLPDGFTTEISPAAARWCREAAEVLRPGKLLTIDYGLTAEELFSPARSEGTLRAYRRHRVVQDLLANPGEQDLTAHVNFTALQAAGEAAGLRTDAFVTQEKFLTDIAARAAQPSSGFGEWTPARTRQFQTLTHPEHLGQKFRVLLQSR